MGGENDSARHVRRIHGRQGTAGGDIWYEERRREPCQQYPRHEREEIHAPGVYQRRTGYAQCVYHGQEGVSEQEGHRPADETPAREGAARVASEDGEVPRQPGDGGRVRAGRHKDNDDACRRGMGRQIETDLQPAARDRD